MEVDIEEISRAELIRVVLESQKYVSDLTDEIQEKDRALEDAQNQLRMTREEWLSSQNYNNDVNTYSYSQNQPNINDNTTYASTSFSTQIISNSSFGEVGSSNVVERFDPEGDEPPKFPENQFENERNEFEGVQTQQYNVPSIEAGCKPCVEEQNDPMATEQKFVLFIKDCRPAEQSSDAPSPKPKVVTKKRKRKKRGRPRSDDADYRPIAPPRKVPRKRKSAKKSQPTEPSEDIEIIELEVDEIDVKLEHCDMPEEDASNDESENIMNDGSFKTITVYKSEWRSKARNYIATIAGPTAVCHICETAFVEIDRVKKHYHKEHSFDICIDIDDQKVKRCVKCDKWYVTGDDLQIHVQDRHGPKRERKRKQPDEETKTVYIEKLAVYDNLEEGHIVLPPTAADDSVLPPTAGKDVTINTVEEASGYIERKKGNYVAVGNPFTFHCYYCSSRFRRRDFCEAHIRSHHFYIRYAYVCAMCNKEFISKLSYTVHLKTHDGEKRRVFCEVCGKNFSNTNNMKRHMIVHSNKHPFLCTFCGMAFSQRGSLDAHLRKHGVMEKFRCGYCCRGYKSTIKLRQHLEHFHHTEQTFICFICDESSPTGDELQSHFTMHKAANDAGKPFGCHICSFITYFPRDLRAHIMSHKSKLRKLPILRTAPINKPRKCGPFFCQFCNKKCAGQDYLDLHEYKHTKIKKFKCIPCDRPFTMASQLKAHTQARHEGLRYPCPTCGKPFTILANVQRHVDEVHNNKRPYNCGTCNKYFSQKSSLNSHLKTQSHHDKVGKQIYMSHQLIENQDIVDKHLMVEGDMKGAYQYICGDGMSIIAETVH